MSLLTQHLGSVQSSVVKFHSAPPNVPYDMSGGFPQGEPYNYGQWIPEQVNYMRNSSRNPYDTPYFQTSNQGWRNHSRTCKEPTKLYAGNPSLPQEPEMQLNQKDQRTPEQPPPSNMAPEYREECQPFRLRSGKTLTTQPKKSEELGEKKTPKQEITETESGREGVEYPSREPRRALNTLEDLKNAPSRHPNDPFLITLDTNPSLPKAPKYKVNLPYSQKL
ncbi:hypothetical protein AHAS_Ahas06G0154200 [Arachis hypogaea]